MPEERGEKGSNKDVNKSSLLEGPLIIKVLGEEAREEEEWDLVIRCEHCGRPVPKIDSGVVETIRRECFRGDGVWLIF